MAYLIGTDEAGYGPNLGPLVISATVWEVPDKLTHADLYKALSKCITADREDSDRLWIADSKLLYKPGGGLSALETGVLSALAVAGQSFVGGWRGLWQALIENENGELKQSPWYADFEESLPIDAETEQVDEAAARLKDGLRAANVRLVQIVSTAIFPGSFNDSLREYDNKAAVLSHETLEMVAKLIESLPKKRNSQVRVLCDKHGARNKYAGLLQHHLSSIADGFVEVKHEAKEVSHYVWKGGGRRVEFQFQAKADSIMTAALASMTSKYLRELAMRAFNRFWCDRKTDLKPTAGYPMDARRFKKQIAKVQAGLGISDQVLWRKK